MHVEVFAASFRYHRGRMPNRTFWRETSAQHYSTPSGVLSVKMPVSLLQICLPLRRMNRSSFKRRLLIREWCACRDV